MLIMAVTLQDTLLKLSQYRTDTLTVAVATLRYGRNRVRITKGARNFFLLQNFYTVSRIHFSLIFSGYWFSSPWLNLSLICICCGGLRMTEAVPLLPVCVFRALIWTILPLSQSLMPLCQWSATKMDKDAFGDGFKKGFLRAWLVLSTCIRTNSKISLLKKHGSQEGLLLLLLLLLLLFIIVIVITWKSISTVLTVCETQTVCLQALKEV